MIFLRHRQISRRSIASCCVEVPTAGCKISSQALEELEQKDLLYIVPLLKSDIIPHFLILDQYLISIMDQKCPKKNLDLICARRIINRKHIMKTSADFSPEVCDHIHIRDVHKNPNPT